MSDTVSQHPEISHHISDIQQTDKIIFTGKSYRSNSNQELGYRLSHLQYSKDI